MSELAEVVIGTGLTAATLALTSTVKRLCRKKSKK